MTHKKDARFDHIQILSLPLNLVKGIGPKRAALLNLKGLYTILDLFYFTPVRYEDRSSVSPIGRIAEGRACLVRGRVMEGKEERFFPSRKRLYRITISDDEGDLLELLWFHYIKPHLAGFSRPGLQITAYGTMKINRGKRQMFHPDVAVSVIGIKDNPGFLPVYGNVKGVPGNTLRSLIGAAVDNYLKDMIDPIPVDLLRRLPLPNLKESLEGVHFPPGDSSIELLNRFETPFHRRLLFDRFFYLMLIMAFRKKVKDNTPKSPYAMPRNLWEDIKEFFEFSLTNDQRQAVEDIIRDLKRGRPMNRMLMGDVGTGKTAVAAIAAHVTVMNNHQVALMAPTQILAEQHMDYFSNLPEGMGFRPVLMTGVIKKGDRERAYQKIKKSEYNLIIGTQSLIREGLKFSDLGLAIIDEQHRFGVRQRVLMEQKGDSPHILVMTATPIPRSLAITLYGDMDISILKKYPVGHRPVKTILIDRKQKKWAFDKLKECISSGYQAFVICPVIEETEESDLKGAEEMYGRLKRILSPPYRIGIVHGRISPDERDGIMQAFYRGLIHILVATTVVEVGVHIPDATVMVIEHPERFGLAQLHQLRGRVGRGTQEGLCMMILPDNIPERTEARLKVLAGSNDGFEIAQKDLEFRGQGELTGLRQSGIGELDPSEIIRHQELLIDAKRYAQDLIQSDPDLSHPYHKYLKKMMESISPAPFDS